MTDNIILQVGVKALIKNDQGKFLLLQRSLEKYPDVTGRWDIVGGRIEPGQPLRANLAREIKEETGLDLVGELQLIAAQDIIIGTTRHVVRLTYLARATGEIELDQTENDQYGWFSWSELNEIVDLDKYLEVIVKQNIINEN